MELEPIWENDDPGPDCDRKYWDEDDWERFINTQDRRMDELSRLADLFMASGMTDRDDELMDEGEEGFEFDDDYCCMECGEHETENASNEPDETMSESLGFREIPAYCLAYDFAIRTIEALKGVSNEVFSSDSAFEKLTANCCLAGAKIAGGHGLGYRPDSIYGNVVKCKQAAAALSTSIEALDILSAHEQFGREAQKLLQMAQKVLRETRIRIEELRAEARRLHADNG